MGTGLGFAVLALVASTALAGSQDPAVAHPAADGDELDCERICNQQVRPDSETPGVAAKAISQLQLGEGLAPQGDDESGPTPFSKELGDLGDDKMIAAPPPAKPSPEAVVSPAPAAEDPEAAPSRYSQELGDLPQGTTEPVEGPKPTGLKKQACLCDKKKKNMGAGCRRENWRKRAKKCLRGGDDDGDLDSEIDKRKAHLKDLEAQLDAEKKAALAAERARKLEEARKAAEAEVKAVPTPAAAATPEAIPEVIKCGNYDPLEGFRPKGQAVPELAPMMKSEFVSRILNAQNQKCGHSNEDVAAEAPANPPANATKAAFAPRQLQDVVWGSGGVREKPTSGATNPDYAGIGPRELALGFPKGEIASAPMPGAKEIVPDRMAAEQAARFKAEAKQAMDIDLDPGQVQQPQGPAGGDDALPLDPDPPSVDGKPGAQPLRQMAMEASQTLVQMEETKDAINLMQAQAGPAPEAVGTKCLSRTCKRENDLNAEQVVLQPMECYDECQVRNCEKKFAQGWEKWYMCVQTCVSNCFTVTSSEATKAKSALHHI